VLLAAGLFAAGIGTMAFLRNSLINSIDAQVDALARSDVAGPLLDVTVRDGRFLATDADDAPPTDYFVAIYGPPDFELQALAGGRAGAPVPVVPDTYPLDLAQSQELTPVTLRSADGESEFRATVAVQEYANAGILYTQLVAVPLTPVNRTITNYLSIYSILALLILAGGAGLTRFMVTLTFRSLGQVESTADAIAAGDFSQRMTDIEPTSTEVGRLKTAINAMLDRVDAAISQRDATVRQMRRFIGDASHELRTPLVTVRGYAELYRMGAIRGDDDVAQSMDRIEKEAIRMGVLVEDLLALARLDERRDVVIAPVDLRPIARDAALDLRASAPRRPVSVVDTTAELLVAPVPPPSPTAENEQKRAPTTALTRAVNLSRLRRRPKAAPAANAPGPRELPEVAPAASAAAPVEAALQPIVLGDENRIRQVVTNLLGNARRFTTADSPIELRVGVDPEGRMGWVEIVDHGEGVPDQIKDKIFQRFWRADTSRTRETGGSGLGLSIVASIVEALHGSVGVTDTPGGGATFRVAFPLADSRDAADHLHIETQPLERLPPDAE
jgi:two-component system OmpR family sensor kinase